MSYSLESGQETMLSWEDGTMPCRVVAAAGRFVLLKPERDDPFSARPHGACSLTYLDGYIPMGLDGEVEASSHPGELRFRLGDIERGGERRASARVAVDGPVLIQVGDYVAQGRLFDVSAGGMRFRHGARIGVRGDIVRVVCDLENGPRIDADAVVCNAGIGVTSVRFTVLRDADEQAIGAWSIERLRHQLAAHAS